eukprot:comp21413_c0_seq1/m.46294 comp21413_c0_seq1/g.46294  ORF comp21413_c0_seq1/g.46294 comp21413_c0_seq1/m.46294 type:complete len:311 (+) comp21413_c0_seq1:84-1016(+)
MFAPAESAQFRDAEVWLEARLSDYDANLHAAIPRIIESIQKDLTTVSHFVRVEIGGSYAREMYLSGLSNVDLFVVLDRKSHDIRAVRAAIGECADALKKSIKGRFVQRDYSLEIDMDFTTFTLIPSFVAPDGLGILFPESGTGTLLYVNNAAIVNRAREVDKLTLGLGPRIVRLVKLWNYLRGRPLKSFHIEVLSYDAFTEKVPVAFAQGLTCFIGYLAHHVRSPLEIPGGCSESSRVLPLDLSYDALSASSYLCEGGRRLFESMSLEIKQAVKVWKDMFGDLDNDAILQKRKSYNHFDEKGKEPMQTSQ